MIKLTKYLKPFTALILLAIIFLFIQAMANLSLPDYMSNIVNIGIQQKGIKNAVPEAIRESKMNKLTAFMKENEQELVLNHYSLITRTSPDYSHYLKKYPALSKEAVYVFKDIKDNKQSTINKLNPILGKAFIVVAGIEKMKTEAKNGIIDFQGHKIPANTDLFAVLRNLSIEQRKQMSEQMNKQFTALGESMIVQAAANPIIDEYKALGMNVDKVQNDYIIHIGLIMVIVSLISAVSIVIVGFLASRTAAGLARNLREFIFTKIEKFSKAELDQFSTASLITRTTNDITQIQRLVILMIRMMIYAPILGIGGVFKALSKSTSMSWIIALAVILILGLVLIVFTVALPKFKIIQKLIDRLNLVTRENLSGIMVIRAFNTQEFEEERFDQANQNLTETNLFVSRIMAAMFPTMILIMNGITLLIVWVGAKQIANSSMQVGDMMAYMQYVIQIISAFLMLSMMFIMVPRASVAAQRVVEVLQTEPKIVDPEQPETPKSELKGVVEFKNVSFRYQGAEENILKNINFKALPGQTTAIIGSTGSGKSTLINLIPRFYDVTAGQILVDGVDVREMEQHDLRNRIGYVPQKSSLFSGTIESNLKYANDEATKEELKKAAEISQSMEFIAEKEKRFLSQIAQGGDNVSGGQKQRLSIARALVKKPEIYLFDASFSALDFKTEAALRKALQEETDESTIIIVAQRVSTIMKAEQIIVLDEGEVAGIGTHPELMETCETYQEIALSQLSEEELS